MKIVKSVQSFSSIGYLCSMPYIGQGKKDFWISRLFDPATNSLKIIKESPEKYKGNYAISVFFILRLILFLENYFKACISFCLIKTVLLIPILAYFMTFHVMWHVSYNVIKWHFFERRLRPNLTLITTKSEK